MDKILAFFIFVIFLVGSYIGAFLWNDGMHILDSIEDEIVSESVNKDMDMPKTKIDTINTPTVIQTEQNDSLNSEVNESPVVNKSETVPTQSTSVSQKKPETAIVQPDAKEEVNPQKDFSNDAVKDLTKPEKTKDNRTIEDALDRLWGGTADKSSSPKNVPSTTKDANTTTNDDQLYNNLNKLMQ